jgi:hypothetical protein
MHPRQMIALLEDLITERAISPVVGRAIEQAVLAKTNQRGAWK